MPFGPNATRPPWNVASAFTPTVPEQVLNKRNSIIHLEYSKILIFKKKEKKIQKFNIHMNNLFYTIKIISPHNTYVVFWFVNDVDSYK